MKASEISLKILLDENQVPEKINWSAPDGGIENEETKAVLLSVWDANAKETLRIDLWTKDMPIDEMKQFFHQTLVAMTNTYERATADDRLANTMRDFCEYFEEKIKEK